MATATGNLIFSPSRTEYARYFPGFKGLLSSDDIFKIYKGNRDNIKSFVHLTSKVAPILKEKVIYSSAGGLLGGVYVVPTYDDSLHGLGTFIVEHESLFLSGKEIDQGFLLTNKLRLGLVDYLAAGASYYQAYNESQELKVSTPRSLLASEVLKQKQTMNHSLNLLLQDQPDDAMSSGTQSSGTLQSFYFEILMEYLLRKFTPIQKRNNMTELDVYSAKTTLFSLNPELKNGFSLKRITCMPSNVDKHLGNIMGRSLGTFSQYLGLRLPQYVGTYLSSDEDWHGHTLFRQFSHRAILEQSLATMLWEEADNKGVDLLTYRLPKGELAILPTEAVNAKLVHLHGEHIEEILDTALSIGKFHSVTTQGTLRNPYEQEPLS